MPKFFRSADDMNFIFTILLPLRFSGDKLVGEVSRLVVAEACIQALDIDLTAGQIYEINSVEVKLSSTRFQIKIMDFTYIF